MLKIPKCKIPITEIPLENHDVKLCVKREDLIHSEISGNKYWKLFYNINQYLQDPPKIPMLITFGGAFSNHIAAVAALGKEVNIPTLGIIRGEELVAFYDKNPTLRFASENGMQFQFVTREAYRDKNSIKIDLTTEFPDALIIEEGGTNELAVQGIQHMLNEDAKDFDYLCSAVGTGGTVAGLSKYCEEYQQVIGFKAVKDDSLEENVFGFSGKRNFKLVEPDHKYGKITDEEVRFINSFFEKYQILLDPIYTSKMMKKLLEMIENNYFEKGTKILAFHTGGLQGVEGANQQLRKQNRALINYNL